MKIGIANTVSTPTRLVSGYSVSAYSLSFDGDQDYVNFTEWSSSVASEFSISFWVKRTDNTNEHFIIGNSTSGFSKRITIDGTSFEIEGSVNGSTATATVTLDTNWHHYVIAHEGGMVTKIYEDGVALTVTQGGFGGSGTFPIDYMGMGGSGAATQEFTGLLYQVAIWDVKLSSGAVSAIYNSGSPIPLQENSGSYTNSGDLQVLWKFEEGSGSTAADSIGSRTGTITSATFSSTTP